MDLKDLNIFETTWDRSSKDIIKVREKVFVEEQRVERSIEMDGNDKDCFQFLATYKNHTIGTARLRQYGKIERVSVLKKYRDLGIGSKIMDTILAKAEKYKMTEIYLHSQVDSKNFYEKIGFRAIGKYFLEADIKHIKMIYNQYL